MLIVPIIVVGEQKASFDLLVASNLKLVEVRQVAFRADMGKKMGDIAEGGLLGADTALEQIKSSLHGRPVRRWRGCKEKAKQVLEHEHRERTKA